MKLGLIGDIHESVENLDAALARLARESIERIILLGDVAETGKRLAPVVERLERAGIRGVWGNHELGLAAYPNAEIRAMFAPEVLAYFGQLVGQLEIGDCLFSHAQAWMDPADPEQPWYTNEPPEHPEMLARSLAANPRRVQFLGHYHRWSIMTPDGPIEWSGEAPILLRPPGRYIVVVHAVLDGWCATYETDTGLLSPLRIGPAREPGI
jgi:hypothetical protein